MPKKNTIPAVADFRREYHNLQKAMRRLEAKWGGEYTLELKKAIKKPKTKREAERGLRQIRKIREDGTRGILAATVAKGMSYSDKPEPIEMSPVLIERAYKALYAANRREVRQRAREAEIAKQRGWDYEENLLKVTKPTVYAKSAEKAEKLIRGARLRGKDLNVRHDGRVIRRSELFRENFYKVLASYPDEISLIFTHFADKYSNQQLIDLAEAFYHSLPKGKSGKRDILPWFNLWDSSSSNSAYLGQNAFDIAELLGISSKDFNNLVSAYEMNSTDLEKIVNKLLDE